MNCPWCKGSGNCPQCNFASKFGSQYGLGVGSFGSRNTYQKDIQNQKASQEKVKKKTVSSHDLPKVFYNKNCFYCGLTTNYLKLHAWKPCNKKCKERQQLSQEIEEIQIQIEIEKTELTQLANSAKEKLISKSIFATKREEKERAYQSSLEALLMSSQFQNEERKEQAKQHLSKKLSKEEILSLINKKEKIDRLETRMQLVLSKNDEQQFQSQIEINPLNS